MARNIVVKPLFFAGMMVECGDADAFVGGVATPSSLVLQAGILTVGLRKDIRTPSSYFLMVIPNTHSQASRLLLYADCAVNIDPSAEQLADIVLATAASAEESLAKNLE